MPHDQDEIGKEIRVATETPGQVFDPGEPDYPPIPTEVVINWWEQYTNLVDPMSDLTPPESGGEGNHG